MEAEWLKEMLKEIQIAIAVKGWLSVPDSPTGRTASNGARDRHIAEWLSQCVAEIDRLTEDLTNEQALVKAQRMALEDRDRLTAEVERLRGALTGIASHPEPSLLRRMARAALSGESGAGEKGTKCTKRGVGETCSDVGCKHAQDGRTPAARRADYEAGRCQFEPAEAGAKEGEKVCGLCGYPGEHRIAGSMGVYCCPAGTPQS